MRGLVHIGRASRLRFSAAPPSQCSFMTTSTNTFLIAACFPPAAREPLGCGLLHQTYLFGVHTSQPNNLDLGGALLGSRHSELGLGFLSPPLLCSPRLVCEMYFLGYLWSPISCAVAVPLPPLAPICLHLPSTAALGKYNPQDLCSKWIPGDGPAFFSRFSFPSTRSRSDRLKAQTLHLRRRLRSAAFSLSLSPRHGALHLDQPRTCSQGPVHAGTGRCFGLLLGRDIAVRCVRGHWVVLRVGSV